MRNEEFGRLLKAAISSIAYSEGKTAPIIEDNLGQSIGVTGATIQRYKAGHVPAESRTVEILAEAAVRRGYLNRAWLQAFLRAGHYPAPEQLLDKLCPTGSIRQSPSRIYHNLPAPTYSQFVMREAAFAEVMDGLRQRSAMVLIASFGGMGKTSLAREVAARSLREDNNDPHFDAIVWVSDKDRPGTTTLSIVLDEIARTLDYPGFTQFEHSEKLREVEQLLRRQRVLVVVDNFETITDGALLSWLLRLPEPSKALVTTREYRREFRRGSWPIELRGMSEQEAHELILQRLRALKLENIVSDLSQVDPLIAATGGNPKAIEIALGCLKYMHEPLPEIVDDLHAARGELFDDLFYRSWSLLNDIEQRTLMAMSLFPSNARREALAMTADVQGYEFDKAVERLADLAMLDIQQVDLYSSARYTLHPLVRAFAGAKLAERPEFAAAARQRWVQWYISLVSIIGWAWNDLNRLDMLDFEQDTIQEVIEWTFQQGLYSETLELAKGVSYYYHVRGLWSREQRIHLLRAKSAHNLSNIEEEAKAYAFYMRLLSQQGNIKEVEIELGRLQELMLSKNLSLDTIVDCKLAVSSYYEAKRDFDKAQHVLHEIINLKDDIYPQIHISALRKLANCLYQQGMFEEAQDILYDVLIKAKQLRAERSAVSIQLILALIALERKETDRASSLLEECLPKAHMYQDRLILALAQRVYSKLQLLRGDIAIALRALTDAIDLYTRLGMRRELDEARTELAQLEAGATNVGG